jgi:D-tyrosyl-tRNA(Tyr) deacylase
MRAVVQRVSQASVDVAGTRTGEIGEGLLVLLGVTHTDTTAQADTLARKIHNVRLLRDERCVAETPGAAILVVSQFTLYGSLTKGRRPSWSDAAPGPVAEPLVDAFVAALRGHGARVETGRFGADMQVALVNDGPVTLLLEA